METLLIEATEDSPKILFNATDGHLSIKGRSYMEDTSPFYIGILEWTRSYFQNPVEKTVLELEFDYLNSSSLCMIIDVIGEFNKYFIMGHEVEIIWSYPTDDESLAEVGDEVSEMFDIPVKKRELVH